MILRCLAAILMADMPFRALVLSGLMLPHIEAFTTEAFAPYENATVEGKTYFDNWLAKFYEFLPTKLREAPDGAEIGKMKRVVALGRKEHLKRRSLSTISQRSWKKGLLADEAVLVLGKTLQCLIDILYDATRDSQAGPAKIAILGLSYWLSGELTVAQIPRTSQLFHVHIHPSARRDGDSGQN
jgi:hypothetical protein